MPRINPLNPATAEGRAKELLDGVQAQLGVTPNIFATFAQAPAVLDGFLQFSGALGTGNLSAALREQIALTVAGENSCDYCASAHTALGSGAGLSQEEMARNLRGNAGDDKTQAALTFAKNVVSNRGVVSDEALAQVRAAGYSEGDIVEIIANISINIFTNYFNHIAGTEINFPEVKAA